MDNYIIKLLIKTPKKQRLFLKVYLIFIPKKMTTTNTRCFDEKIDAMVLSNLDEIDKALVKLHLDFTNGDLEGYKSQRIYYMYAFNKRLKRMLKICKQYYLVSSYKFNPYTTDVKFKMENMLKVLDNLNNFAKKHLKEKDYRIHYY